MRTTEAFLIAMLMIFSIPFLLWRFGKTDYYAPLAVVQTIAGVLLGPSVLGAAYPDYYSTVFSRPVIDALNGIAWWAVLLFVMLAGVELDLKKALASRRDSGVTSGLALGVPFLLGCLAAYALMQFDGWKGAEAMSWQFVLGIGMACAVTALPFLVLLLEKLELLRDPIGQRVLRYASLDDIAIWGMLAVILMDWARVGTGLSFLALCALATRGYRAIMVRAEEGDRWYISLIWLIACSLGADWAGLHYMIGAFLAGAVTDAHWFTQAKLDNLRHHVLQVLMPVYFISAGLKTNWEIGGVSVLVVAAVLLAVAVVGKLAGVHAAAYVLGWRSNDASVIAWLLQTKGLVLIVFADVLLDKGIFTSGTFTALVLSAIGSTMMTIPIVSPKLQRMKSQLIQLALRRAG